jgi:hypothetical protein
MIKTICFSYLETLGYLMMIQTDVFLLEIKCFGVTRIFGIQYLKPGLITDPSIMIIFCLVIS